MKNYFINHHDAEKVRYAMSRVKEEDIANPFHKKYWEFKILNNVNYNNITDAWRAYVMNFILK